MDPLMIHIAKDIHEERLQNYAKRRQINADCIVESEPSLLMRLKEAFVSLTQKETVKSQPTPVNSAPRS